MSQFGKKLSERIKVHVAVTITFTTMCFFLITAIEQDRFDKAMLYLPILWNFLIMYVILCSPKIYQFIEKNLLDKRLREKIEKIKSEFTELISKKECECIDTNEQHVNKISDNEISFKCSSIACVLAAGKTNPTASSREGQKAPKI